MPLNILLADDSVPAQNMGKKILVDAGYQVLTVSNGLEALRRIADAVPDIAILDIFMPGYTGLEICERLRASPATATLPVILTVGKLEPYRAQDGEQVHSNAIIVKPFAAAELVSAVRSLIGSPEVVEEPTVQQSPPKPADSHDSAEDHSAPELQSAGASQEPDEPLFAMGPSATVVQRDEPFFSREGPESLVFNPDAGHTPFSASAIDLLPVASHAPAALDDSAFTEFDLEPEESHYSSAALQVNSVDEEPQLAAADTALAASEPPDMVTEAVIAPVAVTSVSSEAVELEPSTLDIPARDPLLEVMADETGPANLSSDDSSQLPPPEATKAVEDAWTTPAPALDPKEEARRLAFEELFNSTTPFPVENSPVTSPENQTVILPSMADLSKDHPFEVEQDSEIESLEVDQPQFIDHEPDPYLMQEEEPLNAIGKIPERDPQLDGDFEPDLLDVAVVPWQAETTFDVSRDSHSVADERNEPTAMSFIDAPAHESQNTAVEAAAPEAETTAIVHSAETMETISEFPEAEAQPAPQVEIHSEPTVLPEAETVAMPDVVVETDSAEPDVPALLHPAEIVEAAPDVPVAEAQFVPEIETHTELAPPQDATVTQDAPIETHSAASDILATVHPAEIAETAAEAIIEPSQVVPAALLPAVHEIAPEQDLQPVTKTETAPQTPAQLQSESTAPVTSMQAAQSVSAPEVTHRSSEAERIHQAVERVFDRFKPLLVAAIVRELARQD